MTIENLFPDTVQETKKIHKVVEQLITTHPRLNQVLIMPNPLFVLLIF